MSIETSTSNNPFPTSANLGTSEEGVGYSAGSSGMSASGGGVAYESGVNNGTVQRMAQKAHQTVDKLEQTIGTGSEKVMGWQQEYGEMCREQVKASPLAAIGVAFGVGIVFSKLFMR